MYCSANICHQAGSNAVSYLVSLCGESHKNTNQTSPFHTPRLQENTIMYNIISVIKFAYASKSAQNAHASPKNKYHPNTHSFVNGKDGAYGGQTVDVGGAIQRIKTDHIFPLW